MQGPYVHMWLELCTCQWHIRWYLYKWATYIHVHANIRICHICITTKNVHRNVEMYQHNATFCPVIPSWPQHICWCDPLYRCWIVKIPPANGIPWPTPPSHYSPSTPIIDLMRSMHTQCMWHPGTAGKSRLVLPSHSPVANEDSITQYGKCPAVS